MRSEDGSAPVPSDATEPLTRTRPAAISSSQARRLPSPAWARIFCSRSPASVICRSCAPVVERVVAVVEGVVVERVVVDAADPLLGLEPLLEPLEPLGRGGAVGPQPLLQLLDHLGVGHEVAQRWQLAQVVEPELLEERPGRAEQPRLPGTGV